MTAPQWQSEDGIAFAHDGTRARIRLERAEEGNGVTLTMLGRLARLIEQAGRSDHIHVLQLESVGPDFCRGRDNRGESRARLSTYEVRARFMQPVLDVYAALRRCPQPALAVVRGQALGFGCALAGSCDITLAAGGARFALPEIDHQVPPALAMAALQGRVPRKALDWLVYSGQAIDAGQALQWGLASASWPDAEFAERAEGFAAQLAARPRAVLAAIKRFGASLQPRNPDDVDDYAGSLLAITRSQR